MKSERYFQNLLDNLPHIVFTTTPDGIVDYTNRTQISYTGIRAEPGARDIWTEAVHPDDRHAIDAWNEAIMTGVPYVAEMRLLRKTDGAYRWYLVKAALCTDSLGAAGKWCGTATDIHDRKMAEQEAKRLAANLAASLREVEQAHEALRESEERFEYIAMATSDAIWDWNLVTDQVWWNQGYTTLFGNITPKEGTNSASWTDYIHPDDKGWVLDEVRSAIDGTADRWSGEYRFRRRDGSYAYVLDRGFIMRDATGKAVRMVGGMSDLSVRRRNEQNLARLNRALRLVSSCNKALVHATEESALLKEICEIAVDVGGYRMAWVGYAEDDEKCSIVPKASAGAFPSSEDYIDNVRISWSEHQPRGQGPGGQCIRTGRLVISRDIGDDPTLSPWASAAARNGYRGVISLPLCGKDHAFGLLALYTAEPLEANEEEQRLLQDLADNLAFGIRSLRAREESKQIESAVLKISAGVMASAGTEFFENLAHNMADALGAQAACVAKFVSADPPRARSLGAVVFGERLENFEYELAGTPCENLWCDQTYVIPDSSGRLFPSSYPLSSIGARGYVGLRLDDSNGNPSGLLYALFRSPLKKPEFISSTLHIFAARAAAELERYNTDSRIRDQAALLDKTQDAVIVCDVGHRILFWNKGAERLYGWTADEAMGKIKSELLQVDPAINEQATIAVIKHGEWSGQLSYRRKDGSTVPVEAHWSLVKDDQNRVQSIFTINTDITQRKADEREIEKLAFFDTLTGLPNRRLLHDRLGKALEESARSGVIGALLYIDLDNFKSLNDTVGHDKGDLLLKQVAGRLQSSIRRSNTVARLGGDEFVIVLDDLGKNEIHAAGVAEAIAEKVLASFRAPFQLNEVEHHSTPSIGVALFDDSIQSVDELLKRADVAMYQAKAAGRDAIRFFDPEMQRVVNARVAMESDIREGLQVQAFTLHYQPQIDFDGRLTGTEALLRWTHPTRGEVAPLEFIPLAEESGLITFIGEWVLNSACRQLAQWASAPATAGLTVAVNVSARQFRRADFVEQVLGAVTRNNADPSKLKLELTESVLLDNVEAAVVKMKTLKAEGVSFALDDFGTGYSSLAYLKRLPLDQLKIDRSFVDDVLTDMNDAAIAQTIVALGQSLGMMVVAEGVETIEQRDFLAASGCNIYQGFFYSRPLPVDQFENVARSNFESCKANSASPALH